MSEIDDLEMIRYKMLMGMPLEKFITVSRIALNEFQ
jgi:hypothetical protein